MDNITKNDINDIDARMEEAIRQERRKQTQRDKKRKDRAARRRSGRKILLGLVVAAAAVCLIFGLVKIFSSDVYHNEEEFIEFADNTFEKDGVCPEDGVSETEYFYNAGEGVSYAVKRGDSVNKKTKKYLDKKIKSIVKSEKDSMALLIEASAYQCENGTVSTAIHYSTYAADGRHMKREDSHVDTHLFNGKNGKTVDPVQVMNVNYKTKAHEYAQEYFSKKYSKKELSDDWERFVSSDDSNFNKFILTDDQVSFFFDDGTVLKEGEGTSVVNVPDKIIGSTIRPSVLDRYIDKNKPMVALTFDDGPYSKTENRILDTLEENNAVATFFYLGNRMKKDHKSAVRAVKEGCELGNHSWDHPVMSQLDNKQIISQINKTNAEIYKYCGVEPVVARPPYGEYNDRVLKKTDMAQILWSVDTYDWKTRDAKSTFNAVKNVKNLDGKIILMHSIYGETADAVEMMVPWLKEHGYQMVTVSELIKYKTGKPPKAGKVYRKVK